MKQKSDHVLHFDMLPLDVLSEKVDHALHISNSISRLGVLYPVKVTLKKIKN